jgi:hypothetical protein
MKRPSCDRLRRICTYRCCWRYGPASDKAIYCDFRGRPMTASIFACGKARAGRASPSPVGSPLKAALDATPKRSTIILNNSDGAPWTSDGFRASWGKACKRVGVVGLTFHDLRGTAVTRLAIAGCTEAEIATITGHSLRDVRSILDAHYLHRDPALAESAIRKLEGLKGEQSLPTDRPTGPSESGSVPAK